MSLTPRKYDEEPVHFCMDCLSLNIKIIDEVDYCDDCGSVEIQQTNIHNWQRLYEKRYGDTNIIKKIR